PRASVIEEGDRTGARVNPVLEVRHVEHRGNGRAIRRADDIVAALELRGIVPALRVHDDSAGDGVVVDLSTLDGDSARALDGPWREDARGGGCCVGRTLARHGFVRGGERGSGSERERRDECDHWLHIEIPPNRLAASQGWRRTPPMMPDARLARVRARGERGRICGKRPSRRDEANARGPVTGSSHRIAKVDATRPGSALGHRSAHPAGPSPYKSPDEGSPGNENPLGVRYPVSALPLWLLAGASALANDHDHNQGHDRVQTATPIKHVVVISQENDPQHGNCAACDSCQQRSGARSRQPRYERCSSQSPPRRFARTQSGANPRCDRVSRYTERRVSRRQPLTAPCR